MHGIDIRGYFYWSFIDNFEWEMGFSPRFGLLGYDPVTYERTIKNSAKFLGNLSKKSRDVQSTINF